MEGEILKYNLKSYEAKPKKDKQAGPDGIVLTMLSALDALGVDIITGIIQKIYNSRDVCEDFSSLTFVAISKYRALPYNQLNVPGINDYHRYSDEQSK